ncbi:hypothetical protein [Billgrantia aerodenitrificans]|jgi:hypothetical protein|uniref:Uncharacterized protein n=1 Tax=Billgrantia aerodenitrificans TaxID=2733483 RepID=A0ABS9AVR4_9GAMM|nr:hypothetical protein [Halomonas aerodenitrificans]MCE8025830.1 hypothetical protein [Halomonas aerodenitrificans]
MTGLEWYRDAYPEADSGADDEHAAEVEEALADKPTTTSLARLIAEKQAEALGGLLAKYQRSAMVHPEALEAFIRREAAEPRRQAD